MPFRVGCYLIGAWNELHKRETDPPSARSTVAVVIFSSMSNCHPLCHGAQVCPAAQALARLSQRFSELLFRSGSSCSSSGSVSPVALQTCSRRQWPGTQPCSSAAAVVGMAFTTLPVAFFRAEWPQQLVACRTALICRNRILGLRSTWPVGIERSANP